jgi:hypothetical protein
MPAFAKTIRSGLNVTLAVVGKIEIGAFAITFASHLVISSCGLDGSREILRTFHMWYPADCGSKTPRLRFGNATKAEAIAMR